MMRRPVGGASSTGPRSPDLILFAAEQPEEENEMNAENRSRRGGRARIERVIYRQPNARHAVCVMTAGKPRFRTVAGDLEDADRSRRARRSRH